MRTSTGKLSDYWHAAMITTVSACMLAGLAQMVRASAPALSDESRSVTVKLADLNVNAPADVEANR